LFESTVQVTGGYYSYYSYSQRVKLLN